MEVLAGELMQVQVGLHNQLLEPVLDCALSVRLQQDFGGGVGGAFRGEGAGVAGTPGGGGSLGEVAPEGRVEHSTSLLPLTPGVFKLVVSAQVQFRDRPHAWRLAPVNVTVNI